jgi:hypothetical protein
MQFHQTYLTSIRYNLSLNVPVTAQTLHMEATSFSRTSMIIYQSVQRHIP